MIEFVKLALTPIVLISAEGLIILTAQNRYGRVIDRIRELYSIYRADVERRDILKTELLILLKRGKILRNAMIFYFTSIFFCLITSMGLFLRIRQSFCIITFSIALFLFILGVIFSIWDLIFSYKAVEKEVSL